MTAELLEALRRLSVALRRKRPHLRSVDEILADDEPKPRWWWVRD
jgi:hypothetical protein